MFSILGYNFWSKEDKEWKKYVDKKRKNDGWLIYENGNYKKFGSHKLSISSAVGYLQKENKLRNKYNKKTINIKIPKLIRR